MSYCDTPTSWLSLPSTTTCHINIMAQNPNAHNNIMSSHNGIHRRTYPIMTNRTCHHAMSYCVTTTWDVIMTLYNIGYINKSLYNAALCIMTHSSYYDASWSHHNFSEKMVMAKSAWNSMQTANPVTRSPAALPPGPVLFVFDIHFGTPGTQS